MSPPSRGSGGGMRGPNSKDGNQGGDQQFQGKGGFGVFGNSKAATMVVARKAVRTTEEMTSTITTTRLRRTLANLLPRGRERPILHHR